MTTWIQRSRSTLLSIGVATAISACGQAQETPAIVDLAPSVQDPERAFFAQLLDAPFVGAPSLGAEPIDFALAFADLPDEISLSTGAVTVDSLSGATRVADFALYHDLDGTPVGIEADEVLFYNFNPAAIAERVRGNNLSDEVKVADRIELRGVKSIGMDAVSKLLMDEYIDTLEGLASDEEVLADLNAMDIFSYNFGIEKLLIDGFTLYPFAYVAAEEAEALEPVAEPSDESEETMDEVYQDIYDSREESARQGFQLIAAAARSFSIDAIAYENFSADYSMRMDDIDISMDMSASLAGLRGYDRGDLDYSGNWEANFVGEFPIPNESSGTEELSIIPMVGGVSSSSISDMKLGQAFEALANWQMPDKSLTNFLDLGRWEISNYRLDMADETIFNSDKIVFDSDFHWLLPTAIELSLSDTGYDIGNLFSVMTEQMGEEFDAEFTPEQLKTGLEIADRYGFDCFCGDYSLNFTWDEETGDITYHETGNFAEAFSGLTSLNLGFSTPDTIAGLFEADDVESAFQIALISDFAFQGLNWEMNDLGGLTNLFEMLHAIGLAFPEEEGMAMLTYNEPEQLRMLAVNSVIGMKPMVRQQVPGIDPWMDALASFLEEGGTLSIDANPEQPVTAAVAAVLMMGGSEPDPEQIIELFGLTVTHTK